MGCDIHAVVEYRKSYGWTGFVDDCYLSRDYVMFGAMVDGHGRSDEGQRGVAPAKGQPPEPRATDYEAAMRDDDWGTDVGDHTLSWLSPAEFRQAIEMAEAYGRQLWGDYTVGEDYRAMLALLDSLAESVGADGVRLVFGFDN